jgi:hypothetical protein
MKTEKISANPKPNHTFTQLCSAELYKLLEAKFEFHQIKLHICHLQLITLKPSLPLKLNLNWYGSDAEGFSEFMNWHKLKNLSSLNQEYFW